MSTIFLSHAIRDVELTKRMKEWLDNEGYEQTFLDYDEQTGFLGGEAWEPRLYQEIRRAHVVLLALTPNWLASKWCFAEFTQARALGKIVIPVILEALGTTSVVPEIQSIDLISWSVEGRTRLSNRLREIVTELARGFIWDRTRPPYPGIYSFDRDDAAIFFGRDGEIREIQEKLQAHRVFGGSKCLLILGNSGSGKSSLLKAGVLPQLERSKRFWITLPAFRPQNDPTTNLAKALASYNKTPDSWSSWRDELLRPDARPALRGIADRLRVGESSEATIAVAIDQFEEVFTLADDEHRQIFMNVLTTCLQTDLPYLLVATARSDVFSEMLRQAGLAGLPLALDSYLLRPMPLSTLPKIIEGPAKVAAIDLEDNFSTRVMGDVGSTEALPLLAFALRELYERHAQARRLTISDYENLSVPGQQLNPIEGVVSSRADNVFKAAAPDKVEMEALRRAFVSSLVKISDDGIFVRRPAQLSELPKEAMRLINLLVDARLLTRHEEQQTTIIDVAHEALFRVWPVLRGWLDDVRDLLVAKRRLIQFIEAWISSPDAEKSGLLLQGFELRRYSRLLAERPESFDPREKDYLTASIAAHRRKQAWLGALAAIGVAMALGLVVPPLYQQYVQKTALKCDLYAAEPINNVHVPGVAFDEIDPALAIPACRQAAADDPDNPRLVHNLARALDRNGDDAEAVKWYTLAASKNWPPSQNGLGVMLLTARGTGFDLARGISLIRSAAQAGDADGIKNYTNTPLPKSIQGNPEAIAALQRALIAKGSLAQTDASGQWDAATDTALGKFKKATGLDEPGVTAHVLVTLGAVESISAALSASPVSQPQKP